MIFTPGRFLGISDEINARDMMMVPQFAAAHPRKERLGAVGAGVVDAVSLFTGVRLEIEQIHLVIEWIIAVGVVSALKGAGKLDFFERVNGQNL